MEFSQYVRKPFVIEAVEITEDNIAELAPLIGKLKRKQADGTPYIKVNMNLVPNLFTVYPGFFLTRLDGKIRVYSKKSFYKQFMTADEDTLEWVDIAASEVAP